MKMNFKKMGIKKIFFIVGGIVVVTGLLSYQNETIMLNLLVLGIILGAAPYALLSYLEYSRIKAIEDQMPIFLLDLAESQKVGLTLNESLKQASKIDYGRLSPEIKKIYDQLSWGVPVSDVFDRFAKRMKRSKLISRVIRILNESYISGGDIGRTMEATASDITAIKEAEKERKNVTSQHVFVMYAIYFIFIGIVIGLSQTLIPMLELNVETGATTSVLSFKDPCAECKGDGGIYCIGCVVFGGACRILDFGSGGACYYNGLFVVMIVIQGIFSGLVAGQLGEESVIAGLKHSLIMTIIGFSSLVLILKFII